MEPRTWLRAVAVIPRLDADGWARLDPVARWLVAVRAAVLVMTVTAAVLAGLLSLRDGRFDGLRFGLVLVGLVFAHATNNLVNDLTDHLQGIDRGDSFRARYGPQPLEHGLLTVRGMLRYIAVTGGVALGCGAALLVLRGGATAWLFGVGIVLVLAYTWPLKHLGLGEPAVLVVWGPLMVGGGYYVIADALPVGVVLASLPFSMCATSVLFGKHIDKLDQDRRKGVRTLPVILGEARARAVARALVVLPYLLVAACVWRGDLGAPVLVVVAAAPVAARVLPPFRSPRPAAAPPWLPRGVWPLYFVALAFHHMRWFGGLFVLGVLADVMVRSVVGGA
ncbi:MAG: prenyltransferase [Myxococcales bacterium]|nr:prenyltransferase [Myxococcales bacterium]